jgi:hypothetical protein
MRRPGQGTENISQHILTRGSCGIRSENDPRTLRLS